jgi:restriction system protein
LLIRFSIQKLKVNRLLKSGINEIDNMIGEDFEKFLEALFITKGYKVLRTPTSGDFGADLIIQKGNMKTAVQAKRYSDKVGLSAVQEIVAALSHYKCQTGMVVTNNYFTQQAQKLALSNNISLWSREELIKEILISKNN